MNFKKIASALLVAGMATTAFAADGEIGLKANVQTQATKMLADDSSNFSSLWIRANIGAQYKSESIDGLVMLRIFAPQFGNNNVTDASLDKDGKLQTKKSAQDKILADLYWVNYKWSLNENNKMNLKIGHWKTDWSQSTHFGTYIDKDLTARGLWMRDYAHNAIELGWKSGVSQFSAMLTTRDSKMNSGYIRIEEDLKFEFPLEAKLAYRVNAFDPIQNTVAVTHRVAAYLSYKIIPEFRIYGEYAHIGTGDEKVDKKAPNYLAPESKYMEPGKHYNPFYFGAEFAPKDGIMSILMSNLYLEWERIGDRQKVHNSTKKMDDWAWTLAWAKKIGQSKLQFSLYSGNKMSDLGLAFRLTSTFK